MMVNDGEVTMINQQWQTRLTAVKQENERLRERVRVLESENEKIAIRATGDIIELRQQLARARSAIRDTLY